MKMNKQIACIAIFSMGLGVSSLTQAVVTPIYENTFGSGLGGNISNAGGSGRIWADDFSLSGSDTTIQSIQWRGRYVNGPNFTPDNFRIQIYADSGGSGPTGTALEDFIIGDATRVDINTNVMAGINSIPVYDYSVDVAGSQLLTTGTNYWITIFNDSANSNWVWARGGSGTNSNDYNSPNSNLGGIWTEFTDATQDSSFRLYDVPTTSAVPVPAAVWLMGSALIGLFGFKRKTA